MDINIAATIGSCEEFMSSPDSEAGTISVVISPLKVIDANGTGKTQIISGCNMFKSCHNTNCWYSIVSRQMKKTQAGK